MYILETKKVKLEAGSRTPILNASNFQSLLTPGGRRHQPGIDIFCTLTPLIDSVAKKTKADRTIYSNVAPMQTPRTQQLFAQQEPRFIQQNYQNQSNRAGPSGFGYQPFKTA